MGEPYATPQLAQPPLPASPPPGPHLQPKMKLEDIAKRKHVGLLAGGSGLTPMLQVRAAWAGPKTAD